MRAPVTAVAYGLPMTPAQAHDWRLAMAQPGVDAALIVFDFGRALENDFTLETALLSTIPSEIMLRLGLSPWNAPADQGFDVISLNVAPFPKGVAAPANFMLSWTANALAAYSRAWGNVKAFLAAAGRMSAVQSVRANESSPYAGSEWGYCASDEHGNRYEAEWAAAGWRPSLAVAGLKSNMESLAAMFPGVDLSLTIHSPRLSGLRIDESGAVYKKPREFALADQAVTAALAAYIGENRLVCMFDSGVGSGDIDEFWTDFAEQCGGLAIQLAIANRVGDAGPAMVAAEDLGIDWLEVHPDELTAANLSLIADVPANPSGAA